MLKKKLVSINLQSGLRITSLSNKKIIKSIYNSCSEWRFSFFLLNSTAAKIINKPDENKIKKFKWYCCRTNTQP